jgi:FAD:protein FMN transferase
MKVTKGMIILVLLILMLLTGCTIIDVTKVQMGTTVTIKAVGEKKEASSAVDAAFLEISRIESILSNYVNSSEVYTLNNEGKILNPSPEFLELMKKSEFYNKVSQGGFDPTVQPLLNLYSKTFGTENRPPTESEINEVKKLVNFNKVHITDSEIRLEENMSITLGGIAKGYAIDKAITVLKSKGMKAGFVNAGGDIRAFGSNMGQPWVIALQNPRNTSQHITVILIKDNAVATSGDYARYFDPSLSAHHIMDPRTGKSATSLISVTVISQTAVDADALATSVFVMGLSGMELIESLDKTEALVITEEGEILRTSGFSNYEV